jgi:putative endonuclease
MNQKQKLGKWGEELAENFLISQKLQPFLRNYRTSYGEIDLIMKNGEEIVFVEVKTRASLSLGYPEISVTPQKCKHLIAAAQAFFQENPNMECNWRIDVVAIQGNPEDKNPKIEWFENAVN